MSNNEKQRRYATTRQPTIAAIMQGTFRFASKEQAMGHIEILQNSFVLSRQSQEESDDRVILWIRGYEVTPKEKKQGYTGNYALVSISKVDGDKFTLKATKLESELKYHPQRKRPSHNHPNWGHPILRAVKKKRIYATVEEAQKELQLLHEEFPQTTIPLTTKLYTIIYSRQQEPPAKKFVLEIKVQEGDEGGYYIDATPNEYKNNKPVSKQAPGEEGEDEATEQPSNPQGYFTSMVALKRKKKQRPGAADDDAATGNEAAEENPTETQ